MFPMKSVGGGSHIVVGTITAVPSNTGSTNGLFELPEVSVRNVEIRSATREQASVEEIQDGTSHAQRTVSHSWHQI